MGAGPCLVLPQVGGTASCTVQSSAHRASAAVRWRDPTGGRRGGMDQAHCRHRPPDRPGRRSSQDRCSQKDRLNRCPPHQYTHRVRGPRSTADCKPSATHRQRTERRGPPSRGSPGHGGGSDCSGALERLHSAHDRSVPYSDRVEHPRAGVDTNVLPDPGAGNQYTVGFSAHGEL